MGKRVLVVAAHPDDEILGCGGTMALHSQRGDEVYVLILGEGVTSRDEKRDRERREKEIAELKHQVEAANKIVGTKKTFLFDFPDNRFDSVPLLDIIKVVERIKKELEPDIIYTHHHGDLNIDHRITYQAVITVTRPLPDETVKEIYAFEVLSSSEWGYPISFSPDVFFDISGTIDLKIKAMSEYKTELRDYPHPRSLEGVKLNAEHWGMNTGLKYAEAFKVVRMVK